MARKKVADSGGGGGSEWLNTYADMVTLLLTFFILLFSMSSLDAEKFNLMVSAFMSSSDSTSPAIIVLNGQTEGNLQEGLPPAGTEIEAEDAPSIEEVFKKIQEYIEESEFKESVSVSQGEGYVFVQFMNDMLFEPNSAVLRPQTREILRFVGNGIKSMENRCEMISIHGHTAAIPDNPDYAVSDRTLSTDRANAVLSVFEDNIGIDSQKLFAVGWGKTKPRAPDSNNTEEGRSKNRRVEILISTENLLAEQLDNVYEKLVE